MECLLTKRILFLLIAANLSRSDRLFAHSIQLLPLLNNPLNIELLVRHILQSSAIWLQEAESAQRYSRILAGFRASLGWKVTDLQEGKGGIGLDEWVLSAGRGATGNSELRLRGLLLR